MERSKREGERGGNKVVRRPRREWISNGGSMKGRKG